MFSKELGCLAYPQYLPEVERKKEGGNFFGIEFGKSQTQAIVDTINK